MKKLKYFILGAMFLAVIFVGGCVDKSDTIDENNSVLLTNEPNVNLASDPVNCGPCPQLMPPAPNFCDGGTIISGGVNDCGCQLPPKCELK